MKILFIPIINYNCDVGGLENCFYLCYKLFLKHNDMKEKILKRIEAIKEEMQVHLDAQRNYEWSEYEKENGSEQYGRYQEREEKCVLRIRELEWVLSVL